MQEGFHQISPNPSFIKRGAIFSLVKFPLSFSPFQIPLVLSPFVKGGLRGISKRKEKSPPALLFPPLVFPPL